MSKSVQYFVSSFVCVCVCVCIYKMNLISVEAYKNAGVHCLKIKKTDKLWLGMKDVGVVLGVKSIFDLVLKEIHVIYEKKN